MSIFNQFYTKLLPVSKTENKEEEKLQTNIGTLTPQAIEATLVPNNNNSGLGNKASPMDLNNIKNNDTTIDIVTNITGVIRKSNKEMMTVLGVVLNNQQKVMDNKLKTIAGITENVKETRKSVHKIKLKLKDYVTHREFKHFITHLTNPKKSKDRNSSTKAKLNKSRYSRVSLRSPKDQVLQRKSSRKVKIAKTRLKTRNSRYSLEYPDLGTSRRQDLQSKSKSKVKRKKTKSAANKLMGTKNPDVATKSSLKAIKIKKVMSKNDKAEKVIKWDHTKPISTERAKELIATPKTRTEFIKNAKQEKGKPTKNNTGAKKVKEVTFSRYSKEYPDLGTKSNPKKKVIRTDSRHNTIEFEDRY